MSLKSEVLSRKLNHQPKVRIAFFDLELKAPDLRLKTRRACRVKQQALVRTCLLYIDLS